MIGNGYMLVGYLTVCGIDEQLKEEGSRRHEEICVHGFTYLMTVLLDSSVGAPTDSETENEGRSYFTKLRKYLRDPAGM